MIGLFGLITRNSTDKYVIDKMTIPFGGSGSIIKIESGSALLCVTPKPIDSKRRDEYFYCSINDLYVLFSGEISNREFLINSLGDGITSSSGDAEIVANVFSTKGTNGLKVIDGLFCLTIWSNRENKLYLFLDRIGGLKSIYYTNTENGFVFSSSLHGILAVPSVKRKINNNSIAQLFTTGRILPPDSIMENVYKMWPGEMITFNNGSMKSEIVSKVKFSSKIEHDICEEKLYEILKRNIHNLVDENDVGFLLSGGIDSSNIVAIASQITDKNLKVFTASFPGSSLDEKDYAISVARKYNCTQKIITMSDSSMIDSLPQIIWLLEEPFLDYSVIPVFHLFRKIKNEVSIIVSGDGPDHLFGRYYPLAAKIYICHRIRILKRLLNILPSDVLKKIARVSDKEMTDAYNDIFIIPSWGLNNADNFMQLFNNSNIKSNYSTKYFTDLSEKEMNRFENIYDAIAFIDFIVDGSYGVFTKIGKIASGLDIIIREPYLQNEVVDYISSMHIGYKTNGSFIAMMSSRAKEKYILKYMIGSKLLPENIINKKKGGLTPPLGNWLKEKVCVMQPEKIFSETFLGEYDFNMVFIDRIFSEHLKGTRDWSTIIFMMLSLDLFSRMVLEEKFKTMPNIYLEKIYKMPIENV
jgi:asparagine synthase (glutamine-hydrolysing)